MHKLEGEARVLFSDLGSAEVSVRASDFLAETRQRALGRFSGPGRGVRRGMTSRFLVPPRPGELQSTGSIIGHMDQRLYRRWRSWVVLHGGDVDLVETELQMVLADVAQQDMHGILAMNREQRRAFILDLKQLVAEALDRTSFSQIGVEPVVNWEGTLVEQIKPPVATMVLSIGCDL